MLLDLALQKLEVRQTRLPLILAREHQHLVGHVQAIRLAGGADALGGEQDIDSEQPPVISARHRYRYDKRRLSMSRCRTAAPRLRQRRTTPATRKRCSRCMRTMPRSRRSRKAPSMANPQSRRSGSAIRRHETVIDADIDGRVRGRRTGPSRRRLQGHDSGKITQGRYIELWMRDADGWRIHREMWWR